MNYIKALSKMIPAGGHGRKLTNTECNRLRNDGISCSTKWSVIRAYDSPHFGFLYYPLSDGTLSNAGIAVQTVD
jgi:hypothetical protein